MKQLRIDPARRRRGSVRTERIAAEGGFAFPVVLFALVVLSLFGAAALQRTNDELISGQAMSRSVLALYAAEAGLSTAVSGWDQTALDTLMATPGDSLVSSWTSLANSCQFQTVTRRIDGGGSSDKFYSVLSTGRAPDGSLGQRQLGLTIRVGGTLSGQSMVWGSSVDFVDSPQLDGDCAGLHVNGDIDSDGNVQVNGGPISVTGTASGSSYSPTPIEGAAPVTIPPLTVADFWDDCDYIVTNGSAYNVATTTTTSVSNYGWDYGSGTYQSTEDDVPGGTYCFDNDISEINKIEGGDPVSILTTGSIRASGNFSIEPAHPDGILMLAEGDIDWSGNPTLGTATNEGLVYAGAQCYSDDNPRIYGQLICRDGPNPPGSENYATQMYHKSTRVTYSCRAFMEGGGVPVALTGGRSWWQVW